MMDRCASVEIRNWKLIRGHVAVLVLTLTFHGRAVDVAVRASVFTACHVVNVAMSTSLVLRRCLRYRGMRFE